MSESFIESVTLLVITAVLTGILVPVIKGIMDNRTFERQKRYEASLNRQSKIIEAQSQLLDDVTQDLWNFRYLAMAVSVYGMGGKDAKYKEVIAQYHQETWGILNRLRVNMSKSRRLISENAYRDLVEFYQWLTLVFDQKVRKVIDDDQGHLELNRLIYNEVTTKIDELLYFLANELNLTSDNSAPK